jgi:hypothetical protein
MKLTKAQRKLLAIKKAKTQELLKEVDATFLDSIKVCGVSETSDAADWVWQYLTEDDTSAALVTHLVPFESEHAFIAYKRHTGSNAVFLGYIVAKDSKLALRKAAKNAKCTQKSITLIQLS